MNAIFRYRIAARNKPGLGNLRVQHKLYPRPAVREHEAGRAPTHWRQCGQCREAIERCGCGACHTILEIPAGEALVGSPLNRIASRTYIAGVLTNPPENMRRWIKNPPAVDPLTAMPNLGLSDADVSDIVTYLYTLR